MLATRWSWQSWSMRRSGASTLTYGRFLTILSYGRLQNVKKRSVVTLPPTPGHISPPPSLQPLPSPFLVSFSLESCGLLSLSLSLLYFIASNHLTSFKKMKSFAQQNIWYFCQEICTPLQEEQLCQRQGTN